MGVWCLGGFGRACGFVGGRRRGSCWLGRGSFWGGLVLMAGSWAQVAYFSGSRREGQMAGRSLLAHSSSVNMSDVAPSARRAALRAWTNGSLKDRVKAATSTFVLV